MPRQLPFLRSMRLVRPSDFAAATFQHRLAPRAIDPARGAVRQRPAALAAWASRSAARCGSRPCAATPRAAHLPRGLRLSQAELPVGFDIVLVPARPRARARASRKRAASWSTLAHKALARWKRAEDGGRERGARKAREGPPAPRHAAAAPVPALALGLEAAHVPLPRRPAASTRSRPSRRTASCAAACARDWRLLRCQPLCRGGLRSRCRAARARPIRTKHAGCPRPSPCARCS
jgi:hypothetical protein